MGIRIHALLKNFQPGLPGQEKVPSKSIDHRNPFRSPSVPLHPLLRFPVQILGFLPTDVAHEKEKSLFVLLHEQMGRKES